MDCAVINLKSVGIPASSLSLIPAIAQTSVMKEKKEPSHRTMASNSRSTGESAHARDFEDIEKTKTSSLVRERSLHLVYNRDSASVTCYFTPARWMISNSNSDIFKVAIALVCWSPQTW